MPEGSAGIGGFTALDWGIVAGFLLFTTWLGERLSGKQASIRDFFLGGRRLPWYAVAASIVATEISAVTLVALPSVVFREGGDLTYLQLGLVGSLIARWVVALVLVPAYYEREIYSPYDYMGARLGGRVRGVTTALFTLGGALAQSARVYLIAVVLEVLLHRELAWVQGQTGLDPLVASIAAITAVAVVWTWIGGIATVIWTDAILFVVFLGAALIALAIVVDGLPGGFAQMWASGAEAGKLRVLDFSTSPAKPYTIWAALFLVSWGNVAAYGTDQMMAQRVLCCRSVREARLAVVSSYGGMVVTVLVGLVGVALHAWYRERPLAGDALALYTAQPDRIFPIFLLQAVPPGWQGLIVAGIFAAAISSLDSILAALSQTTLSAVVLPLRERALARAGRAPADERDEGAAADEQRWRVHASRALVLAFGVLLALLAGLGEKAQEKYGSILDLALAMAGYAQGALLAGFLLAFLPLPRTRSWGRGFVWAAPLSVLAVFAVAWRQPWAERALGLALAAVLVAWLAAHLRGAAPRPALLARTGLLLACCGTILAVQAAAPALAWTWYVPVGCTSALLFALLLAPKGGPA